MPATTEANTVWQKLLVKRNPWIAFFLTQICPGWGQIYNRDWKWLGIAALVSVVGSTLCTIYLFDTLGKMISAVLIGLVIDTAFSVQAFRKSRQLKVIPREPHHFRWWYFTYRVVCVYFVFAALLFGLPDGYGLFMPTRLHSFQIPSESMVPNLLVGDRLVADGWSFWKSEPRRGDIVVFDYPKDPSIKYVKRLIGLPGDLIELKKGELYINNKLVPQRRSVQPTIREGAWEATEFIENLEGVEHTIYRSQPEWNDNYGPNTVPANHYFMMGDNRDHSSDSRVWGFVSRDQLIGRMVFIYFSWDKDANALRADRIGTLVH